MSWDADQMRSEFTDLQLQAFLDEGLSSEMMSAIEAQLRADSALSERLISMRGEREAGVHSLGEIWRRHRLSCPTRQQLGSYLLGVLDDEISNFIRTHLKQTGCPVCVANCSDLQAERAQQLASVSPSISAQRRRRYFESSAGYLRSSHGDGDAANRY